MDAAQNTESYTQQLTIDTVLPVVSIDGGPSVLTNDPTPTITGMSDVAAGTTVRVTVGAQTRTALVQSEGAWNVRAMALTDGTRTVTATVSDPAGNDGTTSQLLTVDTAAPAVTIDGGANALTNDATPLLSGTADVAPGTTVTVVLADETLTGLVQANGTWSVTASALSDGPHRVVMSVSDEAGNPAGFTQRLVIDTVSPAVAITGGATATTNDLDPTIVGTSGAATGTTVTVSIAGQTMTTLVQSNGTWNATPTRLGEGTWPVLATAPDTAGNVGSATQSLTIAEDAPAGSGGTGSTGATGLTDGAGQTPAPVPSITPLVTPTPTPKPAADGGGSTSAVATTAVAPDTSQKVAGPVLSIGTKVTAPAKGAVVVTATGTVKIKGAKKSIKLNSVTMRVAAGQTLTLKLKPKGSKKVAKAALKQIMTAVKKGKQVTATITLKIVDGAGNTRHAKRTVKLTK